MTLFDIAEQMQDLINPETGEIKDEAAFDSLSMEREQKIESVALWIKNLNADAAEIEAEAARMKERAERKKKKAEQLLNLLKYALNGERFETARCVVTTRRSEKVEVDEGFYNPEYLIFKPAVPTPDKKKLKAALKGGAEIPGAHIVESVNYQIK